jgi:hypothetical protein
MKSERLGHHEATQALVLSVAGAMAILLITNFVLLIWYWIWHRKIRARGFAQLTNGGFTILLVADLRVGIISVFAAATLPIADCSGHKQKGPGVEAGAKSQEEETCYPSPKIGASTTEIMQVIYGLFEWIGCQHFGIGWLFAMSTGSCSWSRKKWSLSLPATYRLLAPQKNEFIADYCSWRCRICFELWIFYSSRTLNVSDYRSDWSDGGISSGSTCW